MEKLNQMKLKSDLIIKARKFAKKKHKHQTRDDKKTPYWKHLQKVVQNLKKLGITDESILCAGWLHDTIEDTDTDYDDIDELFGKKTADIVATVTKDTRMIKKDREIAYCLQLKRGTWQVQVVKLGDILANLEDLENSSKNKKQQVKNKLEYYNAIKNGLKKNKRNIPNLDYGFSTLNKLYLKYNMKI